MYFFNLDINKKVSDFIIRKTGEIYQNIKIETLKDCQILFLAEFDVYNSPNDNLLKVTKLWIKTIEECTTISKDEFLAKLFEYLLENYLDQIVNSYVQNSDIELLFKENKIKNASAEDAYEYFYPEAKNDMYAGYIMLEHELFYDGYYIISDINYTTEKKQVYLKQTIEFLKTINFKFVNDDYKKAISDLEENIKNSKFKTLLKHLNKSNTNFLLEINELNLNNDKSNISEDFKDKKIYVHIVNILYGIYNIKDVLEKNKKLLSYFNGDIKNIQKETFSFQIDKIIENLVNFNNNVNFNQIEKYVALFYYKNYIDDNIDIKYYIKIIEIILNTKTNFFKKGFPNLNTIYPFDFLLYPVLIKEMHKCESSSSPYIETITFKRYCYRV